MSNKDDKQVAEQDDAAENKKASQEKRDISARLAKAFGFEAQMTDDEYANAMIDLPEDRVKNLQVVSDQVKPLARAYYEVVFANPSNSEIADEQYALLKKHVAAVLKDADSNKEFKERLKTNPKFKDISFDVDPDKVAALIANEMEIEAEKARRDLVLAAREEKEEKSEKGRGEDVAMNEPVSPSKLPSKGKGQPNAKASLA